MDRKVALILGLTGGYGAEMARELGRRGYVLRALVRDEARGRAAAARTGAPVELFVGDVLDRPALAAAARGADVIVHGVNAPYPQWERCVVPAAVAVAEVAAAEGATIAFPGNVYNYAPGRGIDEDVAPAPPTRKGQLRVEAEAVLRASTDRGARLVLLRGGDFFGLGGPAWMGQLLKKVPAGGAISVPGPLDVPHQWAFLPDFAWAHAELLARASSLPPVATFHFGGHVLTLRELLDGVREVIGDQARPSRRLPWWLLRAASPFAPMLRELLDMRYLWDRAVIMDGTRLERTVSGLRRTPLREALGTELRALAA